MTYCAIVLADSIASGVRLTTLEVTFPRIILAEFNTHRMLSRNSASSRAIPVEKRIEQVLANPFVPEVFTLNNKGMQALGTADYYVNRLCRQTWLDARDSAVLAAQALVKNKVHKQHANRLLEPFAWHTVVVTATEWENFFALRCHPAAQPEMQITAKLMRDAMKASTPRELKLGEWHLPYIEPSDMETVHAWAGAEGDCSPERLLLAMSVTRCAAVSFERQNAERTVEQTFTRHDDMAKSGHWSPFEHQAKVATYEEVHRYASFRMTTGIGREDPGPRSFEEDFIGNFRAPWLQYRKTFAGEALFHG